MNKTFRCALGAFSASTTFVAALAAATAFAGGKTVDLLTAVPAESEKIFTETIERAGGISTFAHARKPATVDTQTIVRSQSDMLYSQGVFDVSEGMTVTVPKCSSSRSNRRQFRFVIYPGVANQVEIVGRVHDALIAYRRGVRKASRLRDWLRW